MQSMRLHTRPCNHKASSCKCYNFEDPRWNELLHEAAGDEGWTLERIGAICERHRGNQSLHLDVEEDGHVHRVRSDASIHVTDALLDEFALAVGPENMSFTRR